MYIRYRSTRLNLKFLPQTTKPLVFLFTHINLYVMSKNISCYLTKLYIIYPLLSELGLIKNKSHLENLYRLFFPSSFASRILFYRNILLYNSLNFGKKNAKIGQMIKKRFFVCLKNYNFQL